MSPAATIFSISHISQELTRLRELVDNSYGRRDSRLLCTGRENERQFRDDTASIKGYNEPHAPDGRADGCWLEGLARLLRRGVHAVHLRVAILIYEESRY